MMPTGREPGKCTYIHRMYASEQTLAQVYMSCNVSMVMTRSTTLSPDSTISCVSECVPCAPFALTLSGFGQPTKGPYAELHTPDQGVRLLAISNFKNEG